MPARREPQAWAFLAIVVALLGVAVATCPAAETPPPAKDAAPAGPVAYQPAKRIATLANAVVTESSGLACSRLQPGVLWTHNDSGDAAKLYATNLQGANLATLTVKGLQARDWEDMCSARLGGRSWLFVADSGNNLNVACPFQIIVLEEPKVDPARRSVAIKKPYAQVISGRFADGWLDCESLAIDPVGRRLYLVTKRRKEGQTCAIYELPLPRKPSRKVFVVRSVAKLRTSRGVEIPNATSLDISPDGLRAVVLTYGHAWQYVRGANETWAQAFARPGRQVTMPARRQGEAICFGWDQRTLFTTSEGRPCPLWQLSPVAAGKR